MRMPSADTLEEYRAIYHREDLWRPAIDEIRARHGLLGGPCVRGPDGTHIVYLAGTSHVLKLFVPLFERDFTAERLVGRHLAGRLDVATPDIVAEGEVGGWRYLVMTRVPGRSLDKAWPEVSREGRRAIGAQIGRMIGQLRSVPVEGLDALAVDWPAFLSTQIRTAAARQEDSELPWDPAGEIPAYLEPMAGTLAEPFEPALVLADITDEHVLVSASGGSWSVVGYVDFGDAMVGHPEYELVAPGLCIARGHRDILRTLLLAAGYAEPGLDGRLRRRLMAYTLIHRYVKLEDLVTIVPEARAARSLEELARVLWPLS